MQQQIKAIMALIFFLFASGTSYASAVDNGFSLHEQQCLNCHQPDIYLKDDRIVKNFTQLKQRVKQCELANDLLWFEEDVEDVTVYLNSNFYLFHLP